jgi:hypothetical protein
VHLPTVKHSNQIQVHRKVTQRVKTVSHNRKKFLFTPIIKILVNIHWFHASRDFFRQRHNTEIKHSSYVLLFSFVGDMKRFNAYHKVLFHVAGILRSINIQFSPTIEYLCVFRVVKCEFRPPPMSYPATRSDSFECYQCFLCVFIWILINIEEARAKGKQKKERKNYN